MAAPAKDAQCSRTLTAPFRATSGFAATSNIAVIAPALETPSILVIHRRADRGGAAFTHHVYLSRTAIGTANVALRLDRLQMARDAIGTANTEGALEFRNRGRTAVFVPELNDELVDLALPSSELPTVNIYTIAGGVNRPCEGVAPDPCTTLNKSSSNPSALRCVYRHLDGKILS